VTEFIVDAMLEGKLGEVDMFMSYLIENDLASKLDPTITVGILTTTTPMRKGLKNRKALWDACVDTIKSACAPGEFEDVEKSLVLNGESSGGYPGVNLMTGLRDDGDTND